MKYQTLVQIYEALTDDLKAAEKSLELTTSALKKADPDGKLTSGALVDVRKKAFDRVFRLRDALDDFNSQEW